MKKKIIWLDDQFTEHHSILLKPFLDVVKEHSYVIKCKNMSEFLNALKENEFHGMIIDVMLKRDPKIKNFELFGRPNVDYHSTKAGLQIAKIIKSLKKDEEQISPLASIKNAPILLLTNENDNPQEAYNQNYKDLLKLSEGDGNPPLEIHSKGENNIGEKLSAWAQNTVKETESYKL